MKLQTLGLSITTALLLAACGGGSSDNNTPADPQKPSNPQKPSTPQKPTTPPPGDNNVSGAYKGNVFVVPVGSMPGSLADASAIGSDDLAVLNANGKGFPLQPNNIFSGSTTSLKGNITINGQSYKLFIVSGSNYANSKFGYLNDGNNDYIFSQGAYTTNMPTSGSVTYQGDAAVGRSAVANTAVSNFTADFGKKTLTGSITQAERSDVQFQPVNINATINGNAFSTADNATVRSTGHFYGDNAREVGGVFHDSSQSLVGSFGAIRSN